MAAGPSTIPALDGTKAPFTHIGVQDGSGNKAPSVAVVDQNGNPITPAQASDVQAVVARLGSSPAQSSDMAAVVARLGAAPAQTPDIQALGVLIQSVLTTLQAQRAETIWTDDTGAYFLRVDLPGSSAPSWFTIAGAPSAAPGTGARPAAGASITTTTDVFRAINMASGSTPPYNQGDLIKHVENLDPSTGVVLGQFWLNTTQATKLAAAPVPTDLQLIDPQAEGAATLAAQLAGNTSLANAVTALGNILQAVSTNHADLTALGALIGTAADAAWTGTGSATEIGLQKAIALAAMSTNPVTVSWSGMSVSLTGTLPGFATAPAIVLDPSAKGQQPGSGSLSVVLASDQPALGAAKAQKQAGTLSAVGDTVVLAVDSYSTASLQLAALTGSPTGAAVIEATQDKSVSWFPINMVPVAAGATPTPISTLAPGTALQNFEAAVGSFDSIRVRCTTAFSASQPVVLGAYTGGKSTRAGLLPSSNVVGSFFGTYNTTAPTLTNGQTAPLQMDASGNVKISGSFGAQGVYNSTAPTLTSGQSSPLQLDTSGNLKVSGSFAAQGTYNTTAPTLTNGQSTPLQVDANGNLKIAGSFSATVTGTTASSAVVPAITSGSAYAAGNVVGGLLSFTNMVRGGVLSGVINSASIRSKSVQSAAFKLYLFRDNPTASTFTDKAAPAIAGADFDKLIDVVTFPAADSGLGTHTVYAADSIGRSCLLVSTTLYGVLVTTGTPTFASTSDLSVLVAVVDD